jgi:hypothetical protein
VRRGGEDEWPRPRDTIQMRLQTFQGSNGQLIWSEYACVISIYFVFTAELNAEEHY